MKRFFTAGALTLFTLIATHAAAQIPEKLVGTIAIKFPPPKGHCEVTDATKPGAYFLNLMRDALQRDGETLLALHAECDELKRFTANGGNASAEYATYTAANKLIQDSYQTDFIQRSCAALRKKWILFSDSVQQGIRVSGTTTLGVIAEEKGL